MPLTSRSHQGSPTLACSHPDRSAYLHKELQHRVQTEPALFEWIQLAALDGLWYWDLENPENEWMSPELKALFGYTDEEVENSPTWWQKNIFPDDCKLALDAFQDHVNKGTPYSLIVRYYHKDGSTVWVRCRGKALFNDEGKPIRMLGAHNDLTTLMKAQEELKKKEAVLDLLCTTALDGFWDWNMKTGEIYLSARWLNALGYKEGELENRVETWTKLLLQDDREKWEQAISKHKEEGATYNVVLRYKRKDGSIAHMLAQGVAQKDEGGNWARMFGTHTDVSYLEEARSARQANAAKTAFLATMSHEIRTPLNAVLGMAQVLMDTELTEEQLDCVMTLRSSGSHLLSVINDILDFSQIESGAINIDKQDIELQKTVRDVLDVLMNEAEKKSIDLTFDTKIRPEDKFLGDSERIRQVMFNLVGNAIKFSSANDSVGVSIGSEVKDGVLGALITVYDTGCGMSQDQQLIVFNQFTQASADIRRKHGGSGLGLSICKKLVEEMGGMLHVKSELGCGSTFTTWLPGLSNDMIKPEIGAHEVQKVLLFENPSRQFGSIKNGLKAAGCSVQVVSEMGLLKTTYDTYRPHAIAISTASKEKGSSSLDERIMDFLRSAQIKNPGLLFVEVGKSLGHGVRESLGSSAKRLVNFPTSHDIKEIFSLSKIRTPKIEDHMDEICATRAGKKMRVLLAEDNLINQKVMVKLLSRFPIELGLAVNGVEAVQLARQESWDLIFMDCVMPEMSGIEATRVIRERDKDTPIVALTANATTDDRNSCLEAGMVDFLTKPISLDALHRTIGRVHLVEEEGTRTRATYIC